MLKFCENNSVTRHETFIREAIREAEKASEYGDIPIGAIITKDGDIVGRGANRVEIDKDPTQHAEMIAIRDAAKTIGNHRLSGCIMYVTVEPCSMCAGACVLARLDAVFAGAESPKSGAAGSVNDILNSPGLNHRVVYEKGLLNEECSALLSGFFEELRKSAETDSAKKEDSDIA